MTKVSLNESATKFFQYLFRDNPHTIRLIFVDSEVVITKSLNIFITESHIDSIQLLAKLKCKYCDHYVKVNKTPEFIQCSTLCIDHSCHMCLNTNIVEKCPLKKVIHDSTLEFIFCIEHACKQCYSIIRYSSDTDYCQYCRCCSPSCKNSRSCELHMCQKCNTLERCVKRNTLTIDYVSTKYCYKCQCPDNECQNDSSCYIHICHHCNKFIKSVDFDYCKFCKCNDPKCNNIWFKCTLHKCHITGCKKANCQEHKYSIQCENSRCENLAKREYYDPITKISTLLCCKCVSLYMFDYQIDLEDESHHITIFRQNPNIWFLVKVRLLCATKYIDEELELERFRAIPRKSPIESSIEWLIKYAPYWTFMQVCLLLRKS